jgi:hypothetical protein
MPAISIRIRSPSCINTGGSRQMLAPSGVLVMMMSPEGA